MSNINPRRINPRVPWVEVLGKKQEKEVSARQAYKNLGEYDVSMRDIFVGKETETTPQYSHVSSLMRPDNFRAIVRGPVAGELHERVYNVVGKKYHLITPDTIVNLWDEHIGLPVTSIGALDHGERFFLATQLPDVEVGKAKDKIQNTLVLVSPMNGKEAILGLLVPVRLICMNGMVSMGSIKDVFTMRHYQGHVNELPAWLSNIYQHHISKLGEMEELWNLLDAYEVTDQEVTDTLDVAFPLPARLPDTGVDREERERWIAKTDAAISSRNQARKFFHGEGTGIVGEKTAYELYNSVVELIDWGGPEGSGTRMATVRSAAMGMAYKRKEKVLNHMAALVE
jgi:hypothetical protein